MNSETSWAKEIIRCSSCHIRDPVKGGDVRKIGASEGDLDEDEGRAAEAHIALTPLLARPPSLSPRAELQCHSHGRAPLPASLTDPM